MKGISGVPIAPFNGAPHALELSTWLTAALPESKTEAERTAARQKLSDLEQKIALRLEALRINGTL